MAVRTGRAAVVIRPAEPADVGAVLDLLSEAAAWVHRHHGVDQWPDRFPRSVLEATLRAGELFVATEEAAVIGTVTLALADPRFWGARADAVFLHRLAVSRRRAGSGVGRALLDWAAGEAGRLGKAFVCLDVVSENSGLRRYYEAAEFVPCGEVSGRSEDPDGASGRPWNVTLYERGAHPAPGSAPA